MQKQQSATLMTIFSDVLANLAFMFGDDEDAELAPGDGWLETAISYCGSAEGTLRFRCTREFSHLLAGNLLDIDPDDEEADQAGDDAVKEFMNIVCGQLVTALHGTEDIFTLSIPEITCLGETPDFDDHEEGEVVTMSVEGHRVQLTYVRGG